MKLSTYTTLYNLHKFNFPWEDTLNNFLAFTDEVIVSVPTTIEGDITLGTLQFWKEQNKKERLIIVPADIDAKKNTFDGGMKNVALQSCSGDILINMDMDEAYVPTQKKKWIKYAESLLDSSCEAFFVPSIDLWGSPNHIRRNHQIGVKWRMHKRGLYRGVVNFARLGNLIDTSRSDTCELIRADGSLADARYICPPQYLQPECAVYLNNFIYTLHFGYVSFENRIRLNSLWWKEKWEDRSGRQENVALDKKKLEEEPVIEHNLDIE